jgi:phytoene dehydrogenase-like protein
MVRAVVVGAGPNGLAGAVTLARHGVEVTVLEAADRVGGGARSNDDLMPGLLHDDCSAVHPTAMVSPFFRSMDLQRYGLRWCHPRVPLAHPLDDGTAAILSRSLDETAESLGRPDGPRWRRVFGPLADAIDDTAEDVLGPVLHVPRHPVAAARFALLAGLPAALLARAWRGRAAKALFAGVAAHVMHPLSAPLTSSVAALLIPAGHRHGWPVAEGGTRSVTDALVRALQECGGTVHTDHPVRTLADLPPAEIALLDLAPAAAAELLGDRLPGRVARAYRRWRHGPAAFKVDFAVRGGVPWRAAQCRTAGTVHLGGAADEIAASLREVHRGRMPRRPFVLVGQQYLADPSRSVGDTHPIWAYAHVPHGYPGDATAVVMAQIERFAPGFRDRVVASASRSVAQSVAQNRNYVGGDIVGGSSTARQLVARPRLAADPYFTGVPGFYICSAATPPGAGVHGMCGHNAAVRALDALRSRGRESSAAPAVTGDR